MAKIIVTDREGVEHVVEGKTEQTVMEVLREADVGIAAICGGCCSCATCHIYVEPEWAGKMLPKQGYEDELLQELEQKKATSRLSCQIEFTSALDGLRVTVAPDE
jgi:2Fe-2S ferredoxin